MSSTKREGLKDLHVYAIIGDLDRVKQCLSKDIDVNCKDEFLGDTALHKAVGYGRLEVIECLLDHNAHLEARNNEEETPLQCAVENGHFPVVKYLLSQKANTEIKDKLGNTALHKAVWKSQLEIIECLLGHNADLEVRNNEEETPLQCAVENGHFPVVKYLLSQKANTKIKDKLGNTALHKAVWKSQLEIIECLLGHNADLEVRNNEDWTPVHYACSRGNIKVLKHLIVHNANIKAQTYDGKTTLHIAAENNHDDVVKYLLSQGIGMEAKDNKDWTPVHYACSRGNIKVFKHLIVHNANIEAQTYDRKTTLHIAAENNHDDVVKYLLSQGIDMEATDDKGWTPAHCACTRGNIKVLNHLIVHNANIEAQTYDRKTTLHIAAENNYDDVVKYLLSQGIDMEAKDNKGNTALHLCVLSSDPVAVAITLFMNGADLFSMNAKGETPYATAKREEHIDVVQMFKREMRKGLPKELRYLRVEDADSFKNALRAGFYYSYLGKIMLVGNEGVGKTAITAIIIGKKPSKSRKSTEGIDVHISRAAVDLESRKLIPKDLSVEEVAYRNLVMRKRYGGASVEYNTDDTFIGDDDEDDPMTYPDDDINVQKETFEQVQPDQLSTGDTNAKAKEPTGAERESSFFKTVLKKLGLSKNKRETITADMLKKGTIKAGKKGIHTMNFAPVIILDFAGQRVFYSTHQSFLTHRGIYVLTVNGSLLLDDEMTTESPIPGKYGKPTTRGYIEFWVSSILTSSKGRSTMFPKILVVCTHKDLVPVERINEQRSYIYGEITKMFDGTPAIDHLVLDHQIFVNAMDPKDPEVEVLKDALVDIMFEQPSWGEKIPKSWIHLEMSINKQVENGEKVLHRKQLEEINRENPLQTLSEKDLEVFLKVHHSQGDIIYFPLPGLRDHIIIYPAYLVDALKSIVTDKRFCDGKRLRMVNTMNNDGILKKADLAIIWQTNQKFKRHQGHLISLMSHLDILAEPRLYHQETGKLLPTDLFYVPSLVTKEDLTNFGKEDNLCQRSLGLSFTFHSTVLPSAVGFRFISCCVEMYDVDIYQNQRMLFSGMVVVDINKSLTMLVQVKKQRVDIFLIHATSRFQIIPDIATGIRECLNDTLNRISDSYKLSSAGPEVGLESVPFHIEYPCYHIESPCYTKQREGWICSDHGDDLGETMKNWFVDRTIEDCLHDCQGVTQGALGETPSDLQLAKLVLEMRWNDFRQMLLHLGMQVNEIDAIEEDYNNNILNVMFVCLRQWRMKSRSGTLKDVYNAIEKSGSNVHALCKVFRDKPLDVSSNFLEREPTDQDLDTLAKHVIRESLFLTVQLGIDASYWLQEKEDGEKIVIINRDMLRKWRDEHRGGRKMRELAQACSNVKANIGFILSDFYDKR